MKKMMKYLYIIISISFILSFIFIKNNKTVINNTHPKSDDSWVGDVMPFYDNNKWYIFYLEDHRNTNIGFHPFSLMTTDDFLTYKDKGIVIPYVNDYESQERALGTGSIIKDDNGMYHSFYTAHNGDLSPKEAIMHATSKNLKKWTKHPEEMFFGSDQYQRDDFRDPFVFYNEEEKRYWMLITTRKNNMGVIAKYTSDNLIDWNDEGILFENDMGYDGNLECPSLIEYKGKWYLTFSDQWPDRVTHYRVSNSPNGPFNKPTSFDHWDSNAFYAGQLQKDDKDNLYVFAWIPTKENNDDNKPYNWAGNLAIHQLEQQQNGDLYAKPIESIKNNYLNTKTHNVHKTNKTEILIEQTDSQSLIELHTELQKDDKLTFTFNNHIELDSGLHVIIDNEKISYHNTTMKYIDKSNPLSEMYLFETDNLLNIKLIINEDLFIFYINDKQVFSTRILKGSGNDIKIQTNQSNITIKP